MLLRELCCAALGWAVAVVTWAAASRLPRSLLSDEFGAQGLPKLLAGAIAVVSTLIALRAWWGHRRATAPQAPDDVGARQHLKALGVVAIGILFLALAPLAGYFVACAAVLYATAIYYGARAGVGLAVASVLGAAFFWWMFARLLSVSMPAGWWGG